MEKAIARLCVASGCGLWGARKGLWHLDPCPLWSGDCDEEASGQPANEAEHVTPLSAGSPGGGAGVHCWAWKSGILTWRGVSLTGQGTAAALRGSKSGGVCMPGSGSTSVQRAPEPDCERNPAHQWGRSPVRHAVVSAPSEIPSPFRVPLCHGGHHRGNAVMGPGGAWEGKMVDSGPKEPTYQVLELKLLLH